MSRRRNPSRTRDADAVVIPFPGTRQHDAPEPDDDGDLFQWEDLDGFTLDVLDRDTVDEVTEEDPDEIVEADGRWVWEPVDDAPQAETPVGMVSYRIATMCKWTHRHLMENVEIPQPCCYSALITTTRLPGPVRTQRSWLAMQEEDPS